MPGKKNKGGKPQNKKKGADRLTFSARGDSHGLVPEIFRTKCYITFAGTLPGASTTGGLLAYTVSGNSAHIPFYSTLVQANASLYSTSHTCYQSGTYDSRTLQPAGYTNMLGSSSSLYNRYRVLGSAIAVRLTPTSSADNIHCVVSTALSGVPSPTTLCTTTSAPNSSAIQTFTSLENDKWLTMRRSTAQVFGTNSVAITSDIGYGAAYNASPAQEWVWDIVYQVADGTATNAIMGVIVKVEYDVEFYGRQTGAFNDTYAIPRPVLADKTVNTSRESPPKESTPRVPLDWVDATPQESTVDDLVWLNGSQYLRVGAPLHDHTKPRC